MPLEIRELHIKVAVNESEPEATGDAPSAREDADAEGASDREAIIAECVEQVMRILNKQKER